MFLLLVPLGLSLLEHLFNCLFLCLLVLFLLIRFCVCLFLLCNFDVFWSICLLLLYDFDALCNPRLFLFSDLFLDLFLSLLHAFFGRPLLANLRFLLRLLEQLSLTF